MKTKNILTSLVSIPSVFPNEEKMGIFLEGILQKEGFKTKRHYLSKKRFNLFAEKGSGVSAVLFYGHMDTVPVYGKWKTDPFSLVQRGDSLYGLGACDMKGGIAAIISAIRINKKNRKIKIFFGVDEENISEGAWSAIKEYKKWFSDVSLIVVGEPGASPVQTGGASVITLGRRGRAVFSVEVFGKSAHGAQPKKGVNAISEAATIILALDRLKLPKHSLLGGGTLFVRKIEASSTSLSLPDVARFEIDRHLVIPETIASARNQIEKFINNLYVKGRLSKTTDKKAVVSIKKRKTPYLEPYVTSIKDAGVIKILNYTKDIYKNSIINYGSSVADENAFAKSLSIPIVTIGPQGGNLHSANEWVSVRSLEEVVALYSFILENC